MKYKIYIYKFFTITILIYCMWVIVIFYFYSKPMEMKWTYDSFKHKETIINNASNIEKRIIFSAGSNCLFGVDTSTIEEKTLFKVFNFAVRNDIGIDYILYKTKSILKHGDILIMPLEYEMINYDNDWVSLILRDYILTYDKEYLLDLSFLEILKILNSVDIVEFSKIFKKYDKDPNKYSVTTQNLNGDETYKPFDKFIIKKYKPFDIPSRDITYGLNRFKEFSVWCKENKIDLYYTFPNIMYFQEFDDIKYKEYFDNIISFFKNNDIKVLGSLEDSFFDKTLFYDSKYHLNEEGSKIRTALLINNIETEIFNKTNER